MIETIAVIGIISIVAISIMSVINHIFTRYKHYTIIDQIQDLQKAINNRYSYKGDYENLSADSLIQDETAPKSLISNGKLRHALGQEVVVQPSNYGGTNHSYTILFTGLSKKMCSELGAIVWTISESTALVAISINGVKYVWKEKPTQTGNFLPLDATKSLALCNAAKEKENKILWEFQ